MQTVALAPSPLCEALSRAARAVVRCMGGHCEVSLYDLDNVKSPLLHRSGSLASGRDTGLPDQIGAALRQTVQAGRAASSGPSGTSRQLGQPGQYGQSGEELVFFSKTAGGRTLKNTVTFLADDDAPARSASRYAFCVTLDVTPLLGQLDFLDSMLEDSCRVAEPAVPQTPFLIRAQAGEAPASGSHSPEGASRMSSGKGGTGEIVIGYERSSEASGASALNGDRRPLHGQEALSAHIAEALRHVAVPVSLMTNHDRMRLVEHLEARGVFLLKGAVDQVAAALSVTRYTVYYYLKKMRA